MLVAVVIADRTVYTAAQRSKTEEETLRGFREIIRGNAGVMPKECNIDLGKEYALLGSYTEERGGALRKTKCTGNQYFGRGGRGNTKA